MSDSKKPDKTRRNLVVVTSVLGGSATVGVAIPFVASMLPSARAKAAGAPVEVDTDGIKPGELRTVSWRRQPVWVFKRTEEQLKDIKKDNGVVADPNSQVPHQPDYAKNEYRSRKPELAVIIGVCTHLGCTPEKKAESDKGEMGAAWNGGFYCPCHGSMYDFAGRVYQGVPAPTNLWIPRYMYLSQGKIVIGKDEQGEA
ncbi:MAG: ubiquinol-cytochrome c reductase iron-sulfur subunit [Burkholderiales bacterium]